MPPIEDIKAVTGSWEKTARRYYELINAIAQGHPETEALIQSSLHTKTPPNKKPGRKSPDFQGSIKGDDVNVGLADFAVMIRDAAQLGNNQKAAEYILRKQIQYGMHDPVTPEEGKKIARSLAKRISDADPERTKGHSKYSN